VLSRYYTTEGGGFDTHQRPFGGMGPIRKAKVSPMFISDRAELDNLWITQCVNSRA